MAVLNLPYASLRKKSLVKKEEVEDVVRLNLHKSNLSKAKRFAVLLRFLEKSQSLKHLNISQTKITTKMLYQMAILQCTEAANLVTLNISNNGLNSIHTPALLAIIKVNKDLAMLNLNANYLEDDDLIQLLLCLEEVNNVRCLKISDNAISKKGSLYLLAFLKKHRTLTKVDIAGNKIPRTVVAQINAQLVENKRHLKLFQAVEEGNLEWVQHLHQKTSLCRTDRDGNNLLARAIIFNRHRVVAYLLQHGVALENVNAQEQTALALAEACADKKTIKVIKDHTGRSFLMAARQGDLGKVRAMLAMRANINVVFSDSRYNALHEAVAHHNINVAIYLVNRGVSLGARSSSGMTAFQLANAQALGSVCQAIKDRKFSLLKKAVLAEDVESVSEHLKSLPCSFEPASNAALLYHAWKRKHKAITLLLLNADNYFLLESQAFIKHIDDLLEQTEDQRFKEQILEKISKEIRSAVQEGDAEKIKFLVQFKFFSYHFEQNAHAFLQLASDSNHLDVVDILEGELHKQDLYQQVDSLKVRYSGKDRHKTVAVDGERIHAQLKHELAQELGRVKINEKGKTINYVNAKISFVVSDRAHAPGGPHGRRVVTLNLDIPERYSHVEDFYHFKKTGLQTARSLQFFRAVTASLSRARHDDVLAKYEKDSPHFARMFHHSERALYAYLQQTDVLEDLVRQLEREVGHGEAVKGLKFYGAILDLHSRYTLCPNCKESMFFWYHPKYSWAQQLTNTIEEMGHKVLRKTHSIATSVRVSADRIAKASGSDFTDASSVVVDLNTREKSMRTVVLERYDGETQADPHFFVNLSKSTRRAGVKQLKSDESKMAVNKFM